MKIEKKKTSAEIFTGSMADVTFLLIIYFMLTMAFSATKGLDFAVPQEDPNRTRSQARGGGVRAGQGRRFASLSTAGRCRSMDSPSTSRQDRPRLQPPVISKPVILRPDGDAPYGAMMDGVRRAAAGEEASSAWRRTSTSRCRPSARSRTCGARSACSPESEGGTRERAGQRTAGDRRPATELSPELDRLRASSTAEDRRLLRIAVAARRGLPRRPLPDPLPRDGPGGAGRHRAGAQDLRRPAAEVQAAGGAAAAAGPPAAAGAGADPRPHAGRARAGA